MLDLIAISVIILCFGTRAAVEIDRTPFWAVTRNEPNWPGEPYDEAPGFLESFCLAGPALQIRYQWHLDEHRLRTSGMTIEEIYFEPKV